MDKVSTKNNKVQIRIDETDKEILRKIRQIDPEFNVSLFLRKCLRDYGNKLLLGVGSFKIG